MREDPPFSLGLSPVPMQEQDSRLLKTKSLDFKQDSSNQNNPDISSSKIRNTELVSALRRASQINSGQSATRSNIGQRVDKRIEGLPPAQFREEVNSLPPPPPPSALREESFQTSRVTARTLERLDNNHTERPSAQRIDMPVISQSPSLPRRARTLELKKESHNMGEVQNQAQQMTNNRPGGGMSKLQLALAERRARAEREAQADTR